MSGSASILSGFLGITLIAGNVFLEQLGLPVPAAPVLLVAGALAVDRPGWGAGLFVASVLACVAADAVWFAAGRRFGNRVLKLLCRISITPDYCVRDAHRRFDLWGARAIVFGKFVPGLAVVAPPLAGVLGWTWRRMLALSAAAGALWVGAYLAAGLFLRPQIDWLLPRLAGLGGRAALVVVAALALYIGYRWWRRRRFIASLHMARITPAELSRLFQSPPAPLILDVRSAGAFAADRRRIPGAIRVALAEIEQRIAELPRDRDIVLYCTCPNEASAVQSAQVLKRYGFHRVRPLFGGLDAWTEAGYEVEIDSITVSA
jgi:membrane protein DedA with SNARE-associated domain/rhodanese-related sulfurtransferase